MTNRERAERLRDIAQAMRVSKIPMPHVVEEVADTLDPLRPKPGTLVWWREVFFGASKKWQLGEATWEGIHGLGSEGLMTWGDVEYKPARILADDEVAVKLPTVADFGDDGQQAQCMWIFDEDIEDIDEVLRFHDALSVDMPKVTRAALQEVGNDE
jgi:hypothetical protein